MYWYWSTLTFTETTYFLNFPSTVDSVESVICQQKLIRIIRIAVPKELSGSGFWIGKELGAHRILKGF